MHLELRLLFFGLFKLVLQLCDLGGKALLFFAGLVGAILGLHELALQVFLRLGEGLLELVLLLLALFLQLLFFSLQSLGLKLNLLQLGLHFLYFDILCVNLALKLLLGVLLSLDLLFEIVDLGSAFLQLIGSGLDLLCTLL